MKAPVVRFAPSPTGPLHIGGVRTALYNYLFARKHGGRLILRIEDTDQQRFVPGAEAYIMEALEWCGIRFDEGVREGGPNGPYRQSERSAIYRQYADTLLNSGHAYIAFDSPADLEAARKADPHFTYGPASRMNMQNSLSLPAEACERLLESGVAYVVRMRIPEGESVVFEDIVRGEVRYDSKQLDDKVLFKSDGLPTYHLANVVDDHLMEVSHVIRGEEWLPSTPLHVLLYRAFGWQAPKFVHLPLILKPDGKGKLSKRDGVAGGFPVFPLEWKDPATGEVAQGYRESGYLPEAFVNALALLGWHPGVEEDVMSMERMTEMFSLERIHSAGARYDAAKMRWFNQQYLRHAAPESLLPSLREALAEAGLPPCDDVYLLHAFALMKERISFAAETATAGAFLFKAPDSYDEKMAQKNWTPAAAALMLALHDRWQELPHWNASELHDDCHAFIEAQGVGTGKVMAPLRLALTGVPAGPDTFEIAALLGRAESLVRIQRAVELLGS